MRICSAAVRGLLSFGDFSLRLGDRLTVIVGPGGAGKSNLLRVIELCRRVIESTDRGSRNLRAFLTTYLAARHIGYYSRAVEVRVGFELTEPPERALLAAFVRAATVGHVLGTWNLPDTSELDAWVASEVTEDKLAPLMHGEIVRRSTATSCRSTSSPASLEADDRPSRTSQLHSRANMR